MVQEHQHLTNQELFAMDVLCVSASNGNWHEFFFLTVQTIAKRCWCIIRVVARLAKLLSFHGLMAGGRLEGQVHQLPGLVAYPLSSQEEFLVFLSYEIRISSYEKPYFLAGGMISIYSEVKLHHKAFEV